MIAMTSSSSTTCFADIHPLIIQTQILPRLDGQSLSSTAAASSYLRTVTSDDTLWSDICRSTWPSITHPRVHHVISTFPSGHRSFFQDSFKPPFTDMKQSNRHHSMSSFQPGCPLTHWPSDIMSAVDIRYHDDIVYSTVEFTDITTDFLSSTLKIVLKDDTSRQQTTSQPVAVKPRTIDLKVDDLVDDDDATIANLKDSMTLNWILIEPTCKRAVNLSSIKPVLAWITNGIHLRYVVDLPGCDSNEMVECRIEVTLEVGKGATAWHVSEVILYVKDVACNYLTGKDFLVITSRAHMESHNTKRGTAEGGTGCGTDRRECVKKDDTVSSLAGSKLYYSHTLLFILLLLFGYIIVT
ncbi:hypothetical protein L1887_23799 [Cichorium endivia]|nr:hypothetical protein L1887_23799 [Cichorium endivia]